MKFDWDEEKRQKNIRNRKIDFAEITVVFDQFTYTKRDDRFDYGETRFLTFGLYWVKFLPSHTRKRMKWLE